MQQRFQAAIIKRRRKKAFQEAEELAAEAAKGRDQAGIPMVYVSHDADEVRLLVSYSVALW